LEFILGYAKQHGANAIVSMSGSQSNYATLMAAAARRLGWKASFVLTKDVHPEIQGNLLLHNIMGSDIEILDLPPEAVMGEALSRKLDQIADTMKSEGYTPFFIRHALPDITVILASVSWVDAACEITQQLQERNLDAQYLVLGTATGGTQAGLILGFKYLNAPHKVLGISGWKRKKELEALVAERANAVSKYLKLDINVGPNDVGINDEYIGEGIGLPTGECLDALRIVAETEGIFLDPVYCGKAMAGLIDLIRNGVFTSADTVVFLHSGGIPTLFAYDKEILKK
jgi:1-aminocyclopropane-1-carboxylate deaminase/D-cysteine desulfhydrase-like pyridoxal-dependent ACC family enzyme